MPDPLAVLPEDLCMRIILATPRGSWTDFPLVCKRWRQLFGKPSQLWETTKLQVDVDPDADSLPSKDLQLVSKDSLEFLVSCTGGQAWLAQRAPSFKQLQVRLGKLEGGSSRLIWQSLLGGLQGSSLRVLIISTVRGQTDASELTALGSLSTLEVLKIGEIRGCMTKLLLPLRKLQNLQELFVDCNSPDSGSDDYGAAFQGLTGLRKLSLDGYYGRMSTNTVNALTLLEKLEELDVSAMMVTELNLASLSRLSALHCTYKSPDDPSEPDPVSTLPSSLTRLVLTCFHFVPPAVSQCTGLRFLSLEQTDFRHPQEFEEVVGSMRQLERLDLAGSGITSLPLAVAALPKLRILQLFDCGFDAEAFGSSPLLARLEVLLEGPGESLVDSLSAARSLKCLQFRNIHDDGEAKVEVIQSLPSLKDVFWPSRNVEDEPSKTLLETCRRGRPDVKFHIGYPERGSCEAPYVLYPEVEPSERYQF